jgi:hypothetical protein
MCWCTMFYTALLRAVHHEHTGHIALVNIIMPSVHVDYINDMNIASRGLVASANEISFKSPNK